MASIGIRNGKLVLDFRYQGVRCREQTALHDTKTNRAKLEILIKEINAAIRLNKFVYSEYFPGSQRCGQFTETDKKVLKVTTPKITGELVSNIPTFSTFCIEWLLENDVSWKPSYKKNMDIILNGYLLPTFDKYRMDEISRPMLLKFRSNLAKNKGKRNKKITNDWINHIMTPLRQILLEAANRFNFANPFVDIKPLKIDKPMINPLKLEEVKLFLAGVRPDFRNYYTVRFFTGMRTSEIDGLMWKYVDFPRKQILIQETLVDGQPETPKTQSSYRAIQLSDPVLKALLQQRDITGEKMYVFCNKAGNPLAHRNVTKRVWKPTLRLLDLSPRRAYETRHTAATLWLASGENPEWIATQLGHSSTKMLFERYSRFVPNLTRQDGSAFETLISQF